MPARRLRVRLDGVHADAVAALAHGNFELVDDDSADIHLVAVDGDGDGTGPASATPGRGRTARVPAEGAAGASASTDGRSRGYRPDRPGGALTPRERQVLERLGRGATNRQIAQGLYIADNTVKNHVRSILLKLGCQSRTEAVVTAHRLGLLEL